MAVCSNQQPQLHQRTAQDILNARHVPKKNASKEAKNMLNSLSNILKKQTMAHDGIPKTPTGVENGAGAYNGYSPMNTGPHHHQSFSAAAALLLGAGGQGQASSERKYISAPIISGQAAMESAASPQHHQPTQFMSLVKNYLDLSMK